MCAYKRKNMNSKKNKAKRQKTDFLMVVNTFILSIFRVLFIEEKIIANKLLDKFSRTITILLMKNWKKIFISKIKIT